jgi:sugar phosphate isomerase/epimerase
MSQSASVPFALCGYSLPHSLGYLKTKSGESPAVPLTSLDLMRLAKEHRLVGVEFALSALVPSFDGALIDTGVKTNNWKSLLEAEELRLIADYGALLDNEAQHLKDYLQLAQESGAKVVRAVLSHLLCGDRRGLEGGWLAFRDRLAERLREVVPFAEELGICLAVENHQDATSEDLLWLAEQVDYSPAFGVTLDTGNPLAVGEEPIAYTERIAAIVRHIHAKDYKVYRCVEGYRLVRCAAGEGAVPFPEMLAIVAKNGHEVLPAIEMAAQSTRTIPVEQADWWAHYPADHRSHFEAVIPFLERHALPADIPYSSPYESGADSATVVADELELVRQSALYFGEISKR